MPLPNNDLDIGPNDSADKQRRLFYYDQIQASGLFPPEIVNLKNVDVEKVYWRLVNEGLISAGDNPLAALPNPGADRILFWNASTSSYEYLTPSTGLTLSGSSLTVRGASVSQTGMIELATAAETLAGTDGARAVTPITLKNKLDAYYRPLHAGMGNGMQGNNEAVVLPNLVGLTSILTDATNRGGGGDGVEFFAIINVTGLIANPLDTYYCYVAGHDSTQLWLVTAPTPTGPFTWRQAVRTSTTSTNLTGHISSPDVMWFNGKMHLYYHGPVKVGVGQATTVATSTDGINFTERASVAFPLPTNNVTSYCDVSTSYVRVVDAGGYLAAVWQANSLMQNSVTGAVTPSVGFATSVDGLSWQISPVPLLTNIPGELNPFGPGIAKIGGMWWLMVSNFFAGANRRIDLYVSETLTPGSFRKKGKLMDCPPGFDQMDCPLIKWFDGIPRIYFGARNVANGTYGQVFSAQLDWSAL